MKTEDILRIQKLAARIRTLSVISQEGSIHELGESDIIELLEVQQEQASEIERIVKRALKNISVR